MKGVDKKLVLFEYGLTEELEKGCIDNRTQILVENPFKVSNLYPSSSFVSTNLIYWCEYNRWQPPSAIDKEKLDLYSNLNQLLYQSSIKDSTLKHNQKLSSKNEYFLQLDRQTQFNVSKDNSTSFQKVINHVIHDKRISNLCLYTFSNGEYEQFCWPSLRSIDQDTECLLQERFHNKYHRDICSNHQYGETYETKKRILIQQNNTLPFQLNLSKSGLNWQDSSQIIPTSIYKELLVREPATILKELFRAKLYLLNSPLLSTSKSLQTHWSGDPFQILFQKISSRISLEQIKKDSLFPLQQVQEESENSFLDLSLQTHLNLTPELTKELKLKIFENATGRHFEAVIDSLLQTILDFFHPFIKLLKEDTKHTLKTIDPNSGRKTLSVRSKQTSNSSLIITPKKSSQSEEINSNNDEDNSIEDVNDIPSLEIRLNKMDYQSYVQSTNSPNIENSSNNNPSIQSKKRKRFQISKSKEPESNNSLNETTIPTINIDNDKLRKNQITWEHVLLALQNRADEMVIENSSFYHVHNNLPPLYLPSNVISRVENRLLGLFSTPREVSAMSHIPKSIFSKSQKRNAFIPPQSEYC